MTTFLPKKLSTLYMNVGSNAKMAAANIGSVMSSVLRSDIVTVEVAKRPRLTRKHFSVHADLVDGVRTGDDKLRLGGKEAPDAAAEETTTETTASVAKSDWFRGGNRARDSRDQVGSMLDVLCGERSNGWCVSDLQTRPKSGRRRVDSLSNFPFQNQSMPIVKCPPSLVPQT